MRQVPSHSLTRGERTIRKGNKRLLSGSCEVLWEHQDVPYPQISFGGGINGFKNC